MKIKSDFVTNSSSTSFIVCMPPDFQITKEMVENDEYDFKYLIEEYEGEKIENPVETAIKYLNQALKELKEEGKLWMDSIEGGSYSLFYIIANVLTHTGYLIDQYDSDSGDGMIINVLGDKTLDKVMNALIDKTLKQFKVKGEDDVTAKD